jgi:hypothetical protein
MNDDNDYQDKMNRFISENDDPSGYRLSEGVGGQNINATDRYTDISNARGVSQTLMNSNSNIDKSPSVLRYKDNKDNLGDLSPFGGMRRRPFS